VAETDGYGRAIIQGLLGSGSFTPDISPGAAGPALAWSYFFPCAYAGNQAVAWGSKASATAQGGGFTVPTIPGRQYTASIYAHQLTSGVTQQITVDGTTLGTTLTIPLAWTRLQVTFTATQPTHSITVQTSGAVPPGGAYVDNIQVEPGATANTFTTAGPVIYGISRGYIERWPSAWNFAGFRGYAETNGVDAFGPLNLIELQTEVRNAALAKAPDYFWTLGESSPSETFADGSGNYGPSLTLVESPQGPSTTVTVGTATNIAGDPGGSGVLINGTLGVDVPRSTLQAGAQSGPYIVYGDVIPGTWATTVAVWITRSAQPADKQSTAFVISANSPLSAVVPDGILARVLCNGPGSDVQFLGVLGGVSATDVWGDGRPHLYVMQSVVTGDEQFSVWIDGELIGTFTTTLTGYTRPSGLSSIQVGGGVYSLDGFSAAGPPDGVYSNVQIWNRALTTAEIGDLWTAGGGYVGETSGDRIARQLSYGWTGPTSIDTGQSIMAASNLANGTTALAAEQDVTLSENGNFWVDARGRVVFTDRQARYLETTSVYTFGENVAGGEYPYQQGIVFDNDPSRIYNSVVVTQVGGVEARAVSDLSKKRFFPRSYPRTINVLSANETVDAAVYLLQQYQSPRQRVSSIVLDPAAYPPLWPIVLSVEVGNRVTVKRRASGGSLVMSAEYFVEAVSHDGIDMEAGTWLTTLLLSPVGLYQVGILDDPAFGLLDSSMILAY